MDVEGVVLSGVRQAEEDGHYPIPLTCEINNVQTEALFKLIEKECAHAVTRAQGGKGKIGGR